MELGATGLKEQPFRSQGRPIVFVEYAGQRAASQFLHDVCAHRTGLGLLQGPALSGKSTIIRQFASTEKAKRAVAVVNGSGLNTTAMLESVLREFGYEYKFDTVNELLGMLKVFIQQQTVSGRPPLLIIQNIHAVNPSALRVLCELAEVRIRDAFALRMALVSDRPINYIVKAPAMGSMLKRLTSDCHIEPLTMDETCDYLYAKMRHGGCLDPDKVFPGDVCDELHDASGGWPGVVDRLALLALANADRCPVRPDHIAHPAIPKSTRISESAHDGDVVGTKLVKAPTLRLTYNGQVLKEIEFDSTRLLIGRSEHNDICIESDLISRHHAMLVRHGSITLLMDLNSANGTYVNSWRISNQVLVNDDVIMVGEHGIKFVDANARGRAPLRGVSFDETVVFKSMQEMQSDLDGKDATTRPAEGVTDKSSADSARS